MGGVQCKTISGGHTPLNALRFKWEMKVKGQREYPMWGEHCESKPPLTILLVL